MAYYIIENISTNKLMIYQNKDLRTKDAKELQALGHNIKIYNLDGRNIVLHNFSVNNITQEVK